MSFSTTPRGGAITARGGWNATTVFFQDDVCIWNGIEYQSLSTYNVGHQPDISPADWVPQNQGFTVPIRMVSTQVITPSAGSAPFNPVPIGTEGLQVDAWGNVKLGPNSVISPHIWANDNNNFTTATDMLFDGAWLAQSKRILSRHFFGTEANNPSNIQLGRVNCTEFFFFTANADGVSNMITNAQSVGASIGTGVIPPNDLTRMAIGWTVTGGGLPANTTITAINPAANTVTLSNVPGAGAAIAFSGSRDSYPYPTTPGTLVPDRTQYAGVLAQQTLGKIVFRGATAMLAGSAAYQKGSATIFGTQAEDNVQTAPGNNFQAGGAIFVSTLPKGLNLAENDMFGWGPAGITGTLNATLSRNGFMGQTWGNWGDFVIAGAGYSLGRFSALQTVGGTPTNTMVTIGDVGSGGAAGITFSSTRDTGLYRQAAGQIRTEGGFRVDGFLFHTNSAGGGLGFFAAGPVVQQVAGGALGAGFVANGGTAMNSLSTSTGNLAGGAYTFGDVIFALKKYGLLA